jgi:predicted permease
MAEASTSGSPIVDYTEVVAVVIFVQLLGYTLMRAGVINKEGEAGITTYLGHVGLPALLFRQIATLEWDTLNWRLLTAIIGAKGVLCLISLALGPLVTRQSDPNGTSYLHAGLMILTTTNSDDIGLGYPLFTSLYPPALYNHVFLLAALQFFTRAPQPEPPLVLPKCRMHVLGLAWRRYNPVAFFLLGLGHAWRKVRPADGPPDKRAIVAGVLRGLAKNPIVVSVALGLALAYA